MNSVYSKAAGIDTIAGLRRLAVGPDLEGLCGGFATIAESYKGIDLRGPSEDYDFRTRHEIIENQSHRKLRLGEKGLPQASIGQLALSVPSLYEDKKVIASSAVITPVLNGDQIVTLRFDEPFATELQEEKTAVWSAVATISSLSLSKIRANSSRSPEIRIAYIQKTRNGVDPEGLAAVMKETIDESSRSITLLEAVTPESLVYEEAMTATIVDELDSSHTPAVTINNLRAFIIASDFGFDEKTATRMFNTLLNSMKKAKITSDIVAVENFVIGNKLDDTDNSTKITGIRVVDIPKLITSNVATIKGMGAESAALFHAFTDALLSPELKN